MSTANALTPEDRARNFCAGASPKAIEKAIADDLATIDALTAELTEARRLSERFQRIEDGGIYLTVRRQPDHRGRWLWFVEVAEGTASGGSVGHQIGDESFEAAFDQSWAMFEQRRATTTTGESDLEASNDR